MKTEKELIERYNFLIMQEGNKSYNRKYSTIIRYKRIIEIMQGINPIEEKRTLKLKK